MSGKKGYINMDNVRNAPKYLLFIQIGLLCSLEKNNKRYHILKNGKTVLF